MPAPKGNQNAARAKVWSAAIERVLTRDKKGLEELAKALIDRAKSGDIAALKEIGDRLEGKPVQAIEGTGSNGEFKVSLTVSYVGADNGRASAQA